MHDVRQVLARHLQEAAEVFRASAVQCAEPLERAAALATDALRGGGKLLLCGNGGSAADCQHLAAELVGRFSHQVSRPGLPAIALTTDTSNLTAIGNDFGFEQVFARQVQALGRAGDALLAFSTSGTSPNILRALEAARERGMPTVLFGGSTGGTAKGLSQVAVLVPSDDPQHIQEAHAALGHVLCGVIEQRLFPART